VANDIALIRLPFELVTIQSVWVTPPPRLVIDSDAVTNLQLPNGRPLSQGQFKDLNLKHNTIANFANYLIPRAVEISFQQLHKLIDKSYAVTGFSPNTDNEWNTYCGKYPQGTQGLGVGNELVGYRFEGVPVRAPWNIQGVPPLRVTPVCLGDSGAGVVARPWSRSMEPPLPALFAVVSSVSESIVSSVSESIDGGSTVRCFDKWNALLLSPHEKKIRAWAFEQPGGP
jgi:hypothetical protein